MSAIAGGRRWLWAVEKCRSMEHVKQAHALALTTGLASHAFALTRILAFCSDPRRGSLSYASRLFRRIRRPTICAWNTLLKAYLLRHRLAQTLQLYRELLRSGAVLPDNYTLPYVLKACARLRSPLLGLLLHGHASKLGLERDVFVGNSLIVLYAELRGMEAARQVFDEMPSLSAVSWTVMISGYGNACGVEEARLFFDIAPVKDRATWGAMLCGYVRNGCFKEALCLFRSIQSTGVEPDEAMFVSVLCACAHLGALEVGIWVHGQLERVGPALSVRLSTALIDMYAKCGNLDLAKRIFNETPEKDTICWNCMISATATHGYGEAALELFWEMEKSGVRPDDITFIAVFTACSYSGMAYEGTKVLERMSRVHKIEPKSEHYGCMVDLLSRAGLFDEAKEMMGRITSEGSEEEVAWRAFLSACFKHGQADVAEHAWEKLSRCGGESGFYVLLSNLYAWAGNGGEAGRVRSVMKKRGVEKVPGCSSVEINGTVHEFVAGETTDEIRRVLWKINKHSSQ